MFHHPGNFRRLVLLLVRGCPEALVFQAAAALGKQKGTFLPWARCLVQKAASLFLAVPDPDKIEAFAPVPLGPDFYLGGDALSCRSPSGGLVSLSASSSYPGRLRCSLTVFQPPCSRFPTYSWAIIDLSIGPKISSEHSAIIFALVSIRRVNIWEKTSRESGSTFHEMRASAL